MRGNKRRAAAVTAANKPQPALNDAILDVANRRGIRSCVECGATSTPQWREGPMGPKTLCNACGVRRQRLLRKQQAATLANVPTAPVAAAQARRRLLGRTTLQSSHMDSDETPYGVASASEHSSDETEVDWATGRTNMKHQQEQQLQQLHEEQLIASHEMEESCNEDESAAYDLLFFAGVECGHSSGGGVSGSGAHSNTPPLSGGWRSKQHYPSHGHGHNTRRHLNPLRRLDDFYYYEEEASGLEDGGDGGDNCKRCRTDSPPRIPAPPRRRAAQQYLVPPWMGTPSSLPSTEDVADVAESGLASRLATASLSSVQQYHQQQQPQQIEGQEQDQQQHSVDPKLGERRPTYPVNCGSLDTTSLNRGLPPPPSFSAVSDSSPALPAAASMALTGGAAAAVAAFFPFAPRLSATVPLPVLPLSVPALSLPALSARDLGILAKLQLDFQRACLQLHHANAACEAVGAVVAERRQAAASAHEQAAAASRQLASEAKTMADRYQLRDVLSELHSVTAAERSGPAAEGSVAACGGTDMK